MILEADINFIYLYVHFSYIQSLRVVLHRSKSGLSCNV